MVIAVEASSYAEGVELEDASFGVEAVVDMMAG
jgi:hypothetical protein